jgi:glycosyltransferase involved in cell wall biosynthesis
MPGRLNSQEVVWGWPDFDCAVHVPLSENCGGVVEPLLAGVPTIAGNVGGLPEVVQRGLTGELVPTRSPQLLAEAVFKLLDHYDEFRRMAEQGRQLANVMFDSERCSNEILAIYRHLLFNESRPPAFDSRNFLVSSQAPNLKNLVPSLKLADAVC